MGKSMKKIVLLTLICGLATCRQIQSMEQDIKRKKSALIFALLTDTFCTGFLAPQHKASDIFLLGISNGIKHRYALNPKALPQYLLQTATHGLGYVIRYGLSKLFYPNNIKLAWTWEIVSWLCFGSYKNSALKSIASNYNEIQNAIKLQNKVNNPDDNNFGYSDLQELIKIQDKDSLQKMLKKLLEIQCKKDDYFDSNAKINTIKCHYNALERFIVHMNLQNSVTVNDKNIYYAFDHNSLIWIIDQDKISEYSDL